MRYALPESVRLAGLAMAGALAVFAVNGLNADTAGGPATAAMAGLQPTLRASIPPDTARRPRARRSLSSSSAEAGTSDAPLGNHASGMRSDHRARLGLDMESALNADALDESVLASLALGHPVPAVREEALHALGERGGSIALQTLQLATQDERARVQKAAIRSLGEASAEGGGVQAGQALVAMLDSNDPSLTLEAIDALGKSGRPAARSHLEQMLQHENEVIREAAAEWLAELR